MGQTAQAAVEGEDFEETGVKTQAQRLTAVRESYFCAGQPPHAANRLSGVFPRGSAFILRKGASFRNGRAALTAHWR